MRYAEGRAENVLTGASWRAWTRVEGSRPKRERRKRSQELSLPDCAHPSSVQDRTAEQRRVVHYMLCLCSGRPLATATATATVTATVTRLFSSGHILRTAPPRPASPTSTSTRNSTKMYLFLDYDETLTSHDTLSLIPSPSGDFTSYTQAYLSDLRAHEASWEGERSSLRGQLRFLGSLADVERKSVARVEKGGLFLGWRPQEAEKRAREEVRLRRGVLSSSLQTGEGVGAEAGESGGGSLEDFLRRTTTSTSNATSSSTSPHSSSASSSSTCPHPHPHVHSGILSVSWSTAFLRASLHPLPLQFVHANDPVLDPSMGRGTGKLNKGAADGEQQGGIRTGLDKLRLMRREMGNVEAQQRGQERERGERYSVYAGDSNTDLPCLLEASLGLILGEANSLLSTLERIGLRDRVLDGYEALQRWLEEGKQGEQGGEGWGRLHPVDPARIQPWQEAEEERRAQDVCLVRVADWVEGTKVLELVLALEEGKSAQVGGKKSAV